jgi:HEPN domain-containing protein
VPRPGKVVAVARGEARLYLGKAGQFLAEARSAVKESRFDASLLNAIHAAISAADSVTVALSGRRSADPDHQRAADLLEEVAARSEAIKTKARQLRMLLAKKNVVEYESRRATAKEASDAVDRAARLVEWAEETVTRAKV